jgi:hypothetical protein
MTHDDAVALARRWMEGGASEPEVREQLRRAGFDGRAADGVVQEAYRSRLRFRGKRVFEFDAKQLALFVIGGLFLLLAPFMGAPWSLFGGFNLLPFFVGGLGIGLMITAVKMRPNLK